MIPARTDEELMKKFTAWDGVREDYFTPEELGRVLELAKAANPELLEATVRHVTEDMARARGMSVEGLVTVMRSAVATKRKKQ